jgi:hypothetical protein
MAQFVPGDFVMFMDVRSKPAGKLGVRWSGPAQVMKATSDWIFEIKNLVTNQVKECHASRLKFYADHSLNVDQELLDHVAHNGEGHVVEKIVDCRYSAPMKRYEVLVHWRGLDSIEDSWEPAAVLLEDVPQVMQRYVKAHADHPVVMKMKQALKI